MKRRCAFLDNCPGFNYNTGSSDYVTNAQGKREKNDTTQLGSTLMDTMLKEVGDFCDPFIRENWAMKPHHQVCCMYRNVLFILMQNQYKPCNIWHACLLSKFKADSTYQLFTITHVMSENFYCSSTTCAVYLCILNHRCLDIDGC